MQQKRSVIGFERRHWLGAVAIIMATLMFSLHRTMHHYLQPANVVEEQEVVVAVFNIKFPNLRDKELQMVPAVHMKCNAVIPMQCLVI